MSEPTKVNCLNAAVIRQIKAKMREDPNMGRAVPFKLTAKLNTDTGIVTSTTPEGLVSAPMPHTGMDLLDPSLPTSLSYCPLMSGTCFSIVYMINAAERDMSFDEYKFETRSSANMGMFYDKETAECTAPWNSVDLKFSVKGLHTKKDVDDLLNIAHKNCPAAALLEKPFGLKTAFKNKITEDAPEPAKDGCLNGYDIAKYKAFAGKVSQDKNVAIMEQESKGVYFCNDECETNPGAVMEQSVDGVTLPVSMDPPIGPGKYANPIQYCFFGATSFYMHTFAMRLSVRGIHIKSLSATFSSSMNKRSMLGVDEDKRTFEQGTLEVDIECNATDEVLDEVQKETDLMCPAVHALLNSVIMNVSAEQI